MSGNGDLFLLAIYFINSAFLGYFVYPLMHRSLAYLRSPNTVCFVLGAGLGLGLGAGLGAGLGVGVASSNLTVPIFSRVGCLNSRLSLLSN